MSWQVTYITKGQMLQPGNAILAAATARNTYSQWFHGVPNSRDILIFGIGPWGLLRLGTFYVKPHPIVQLTSFLFQGPAW